MNASNLEKYLTSEREAALKQIARMEKQVAGLQASIARLTAKANELTAALNNLSGASNAATGFNLPLSLPLPPQPSVGLPPGFMPAPPPAIQFPNANE